MKLCQEKNVYSKCIFSRYMINRKICKNIHRNTNYNNFSKLTLLFEKLFSYFDFIIYQDLFPSLWELKKNPNKLEKIFRTIKVTRNNYIV